MSSLANFAKKILGTQNERELKRIAPIVTKINSLEPAFAALSEKELQAKTVEFKKRFQDGETLDDLLPEAFAAVREAGKRVLGMRHYDVQMIGGITLHKGRIAEMKTGEGKTLVATLPVYLNALSGKGVHVITVNDYLARRDSEWMGRLYKYMGLTVGIIVHGLTDRQRKENYRCDITYGTNNEYGFDYLRDNMKFSLEDYVQRDLNYALIDEVDSILIDEARTPLIISGPSEASTDLYYKIDKTITQEGGLTKDEDYTVDEKSKTAVLTEKGVDRMEKRLGIENLYDPVHIETLHHVNQALRAHVIFKRDVDYVVNESGEVMIVDEFTGRLMPGRRWSDGLHQAIEAKEGVEIENENQTLATITFQNFFRMYNKLSGMTGTADTEASEFKQIYKLDVTVIPPNKQMRRTDLHDVIYKAEDKKYDSIVTQIKELREKGQPVLVGTISVEKSEHIAKILKRDGIPHHVLNAKQHAREADVIAQAGRKGAITIATNMAGRGTDILLGGNPDGMTKAELGNEPNHEGDLEKEAEWKRKWEERLEYWKKKCSEEREEVLKAGGLFILGTERHESRRIDNQLRGRAGRQGDVGASRFYLSLDDDLMRIFGGVNIKRFMEDDLPIEHRWINKAIENAQRKVEAHNYDIRKHLLEYDDVMNQQRKVVYQWRREVLSQPNLREMVFSMVDEISAVIAEDFFPGGKLPYVNGQRVLNKKELQDALQVTFQIPLASMDQDIESLIDPFNDKGLKKLIYQLAEKAYEAKEKSVGTENMRQIERMVLLTTIDQLWKDHLLAMDHMREGIGLRGYGQKDPLVEYKKEGFRYFSMMMHQITGDVIRKIFAVQLAQESSYRMQSVFADQPMEMNVSGDGELVPQKQALPPGQVLPQPKAFNVPMQMGRGNPVQNQGAVSLGIGAGSPRAPHPASLARPVESGQPKVGRNDPCPCGSGKKYKKCHGTNA